MSALTIPLQTVFFGANDAVLAPYAQHVPLDQYKSNLQKILAYPATQGQNPKILVLTPPPVNEHQLQIFDAEKGFPTPSRTAANTKVYADACREVATAAGYPVVDIWTALMTAAGWKPGQPLVGSKDQPPNERLASFFTDGACLPRSYGFRTNSAKSRTTLDWRGLQSRIRRTDEGPKGNLARGRSRETANDVPSLGASAQMKDPLVHSRI